MTLFFIGFGLLRLLGFAFVVLLFIKIGSVFAAKMDGKHREFFKNHGTFEAINLAARRFADGDITADQYREIKSVLKD